MPLSAFLPLDTLSRTAGGASSRAALSTLDGRPVRGSAAFSFFPADIAACSFGGRPRRFFGCSASGAFSSGIGASLPSLSVAGAFNLSTAPCAAACRWDINDYIHTESSSPIFIIVIRSPVSNVPHIPGASGATLQNRPCPRRWRKTYAAPGAWPWQRR